MTARADALNGNRVTASSGDADTDSAVGVIEPEGRYEALYSVQAESATTARVN